MGSGGDLSREQYRHVPGERRRELLLEIRGELEYQDNHWGTTFDDKNTINDWVTFITMYVSQAANRQAQPADARRRLTQAAALCLAAIETFDRNGGVFAPRHYTDITTGDF